MLANTKVEREEVKMASEIDLNEIILLLLQWSVIPSCLYGHSDYVRKSIQWINSNWWEIGEKNHQNQN